MSADPEAISPASGTPRLDYLDALRGIAALSVAFFHVSIARPSADFGKFGNEVIDVLANYVDLGKLGVVVFFAVSGFIIPSSLHRGGAAPTRRFLVSRFFRLYPLYWFSLLACVLVAPEAWRPSLHQFALNLTMIQGFLLTPDVNGASWTLEIELVFYAICLGLFLCGLLHRRPVQFAAFLMMLAGSVAMAYARYTMGRKLPVALPLAMTVMFFGCLWRGALLERDPAAARYARWAMVCLGVAIPIICVTAYSVDYGYNEWPLPYFISYSGGLAIFVAVTRWPRKYPRAVVHLGTISYSIYLLHTPVALMAHQFGWTPRPEAGVLENWALLVAVLAVVVAVSHITYLWVERPAIALGRRLGRLPPRVAILVPGGVR